MDQGRFPEVTGGLIRTRGALQLVGPGVRSVLGNITVAQEDRGRWLMRSTLGQLGDGPIVFELHNLLIEFLPGEGHFLLAGELTFGKAWALQLGTQDAAGVVVGVVVIEAEVVPAEESIGWVESGTPDATADPDDWRAAPIGPDVIVGELHQIDSYGTFGFSDIYAFAVGTISCNIGDERLSWYADTNQHPVIAQDMYRLKDERFEHIGMSWVKHGFYAVSGTLCGPCEDQTSGTQLGVGCSDPYSAALNGRQYNMDGRSIVDPHTGYFQYPQPEGPTPTPTIGRRLQVHEDDLDPQYNVGALYFVEGHYIAPDDAAAGNDNNNASYRLATVSSTDGSYTASVAGSTRRMQAAIRAWKDYEPSVVETDLQVEDGGLFILAAKSVDLGGGWWRYEYALQNLNSDRCAGSFSVPILPGAAILNDGFHDVDYHSGDPYSGVNWSLNVGNDAVTWSTTPHDTDPDANALRWGTLYNFWFEADVEPGDVQATIGLFKPGIPVEIAGPTIGAVPAPAVCGNGDIDPPEECDPPDGTTCHTDCKLISGDALRGGLLWDKWWLVTGNEEPTGDHPLYPTPRAQSGSTTFRCKECHGWDYKGVDGAYGSGSHYTGIPGVEDSALDYSEMFDLLKSDSVPDGHGFENYGLADEDIWDLVHFVNQLVIDTDLYIDPAGLFFGDAVQGQINYTTSPSVSCVTCHGADGTAINFGTTQEPHWIGTIAANNPWELLHKIRFGQPGVFMPSWLADGGTDQGAADIGRYAEATFPVTCLSDAHCDDGLFCNGPETCEADACVAGADPCPDQPCDEFTDACGVADALRGGLLWDKWWVVKQEPAPVGDHPLYPPDGQQSGSTTHRCKECHGWDYKGVTGAYGSGSHYTGIGGVFGSALTPEAMAELISSDGGTVPNGHGFGDSALNEQDVWDLVHFIQDQAVDTDVYIDGAAGFLGDAVQGASLWASGPTGASPERQAAIACQVCHGSDGTAINFGTSAQPAWVGTVAWDNPWELLHKIRFGLPGGPMDSWLGDGGTDQGAADIGLHAQLVFPVDCTSDAHCIDDEFCNGTEPCDGRFCEPGDDPCPDGVCDETIDTCLSGLCEAPLVEAVGARYLAITPQPTDSSTAQALLVEPQCAGATPRYVGSLRCGGVGEMCRIDKDCNTCSFGHNPCVTDDDCDFGFCSSGAECSLTLQNCADLSECVRIDYCNVGGPCVAGEFKPIDLNDDGLFDGIVGMLVADPADAAFMTPAEWGTSLMRCSKTAIPCTEDSDCERGICATTAPCSVAAQNCIDGSSCLLDEACVPGRVYVTGEGVVPSDWVENALAPSTYIVRSNCATLGSPDISLPQAATMWLWGDTNNNAFVNVADIQFIILAIQGYYFYSTVVTDDLTGITACEPQQVVNITDVLMAIRSLQGEAYADIGCYTPCP